VSFTEKIDVLDLLINTIKDHEKKLDGLVERLEKLELDELVERVEKLEKLLEKQ